jgi:hypothetical protein
MSRQRQEPTGEWWSVKMFADHWNVSPRTAAARLTKLHALQGVERFGRARGRRYNAVQVHKALLEQED